jgi:hypothetical protein
MRYHVFHRVARHSETLQDHIVCWDPDQGYFLADDERLMVHEQYMPSFDSEQDAIEEATHRHYKGGLYRMIEVIHQPGKDSLVLYDHLWPHVRGLWLRPVELFMGKTKEGQERFAKIGLVFDGNIVRRCG